MKLNKKQLPFYAAIVQTIQYAVAGYLLLEWIGAFSVGTMGALVSLSMAYAASQVADVAKGRKLQSYLALIGLIVLSPILVGTATFYHLTIIVNPVWRGVVAAVWGIIPDGAVALAGFVAGRGLVERDEKARKTSQKSAQAKPAKRKPSLSEFSCRYAGAGCGRKFASQNSANAHARSCGFKPTIAMPVDVSDKAVK